MYQLLCMTYEPVSYTADGNRYSAGKAYFNANLTLYPAGGACPDCYNNSAYRDNMGNMIAWNAESGKGVWYINEQWAVWSGVLTTAGDIVVYGNLQGQVKVVNANSGKLLWRFKTPSGIIGNINTWKHEYKQYIGVLAGVGGWAGATTAISGLDAAPGTYYTGGVGGNRQLKAPTVGAGVITVFSLID